MKFTQELVVKGAGFFPGSDGFSPTGTVFIEEEMTAETSGGRCWGTRTIARPVTQVEVIERIAHAGFPMLAEVTFEEVIGRKGEKMAISNIKPLRRAEEPVKEKKAA